jgi:hypothetical protein
MSRWATQVEGSDVPHLTPEQKSQLINSIPLHQRDARTKGVPVLGAGQIYPIEEGAVLTDPFQIPPYWPRCVYREPHPVC